MFMGHYTHSLDDKGRVAIPSEFRGMGENEISKWVVTQGFDKCLLLRTESEWEKFVNKVKSLPYSHKKNRLIMRRTIAPARIVSSDKQGRILIPQNLREFADIDKEVILAGVNTIIEIWSKSLWEEDLTNELPDEALMHLDF